MKKIFKSFATTLFIGAGFFSGINAIQHANQESITDIVKNIKKVKNNNRYIYNLAPGQEFDPSSSEFNGYWNNLERYYNDSLSNTGSAYWLMAIEDVTPVADYYEIEFDYSFYASSFINYAFDTSLTVSNEFENYKETWSLKEIQNHYSPYDYEKDTIQVPKWSVSDNQNLLFDVEFTISQSSNYSFKNYIHSEFDLLGYEYLNDFRIDSFNVINDSIKSESFEFLIDIKQTNEDLFVPYPNNLILFSNEKPLKTEFIEYQGSFLKYRVSELQPDSFYTNFSVGIIGFSNIASLGNFVLNTKSDGLNTNFWVIVGSTIGGLMVLLLIILLIIFIFKRSNQKEEYNVYNDYISLKEENNKYIEITQTESKKEYLSNDYEFIANENSYEKD